MAAPQTPGEWVEFFAVAHREYVDALKALALRDSSQAESLFADLQPFWVWQYKQTCDAPVNLLAVDCHHYTFGTDNPAEIGGAGADRTFLVYGRSVEDASLDSLLTLLMASAAKPGERGRRELIDRIRWLRSDQFDAMSRRVKSDCRRAEQVIAVALGLKHLIAAARSSHDDVRNQAEAAVLRATGHPLATDLDWFDSWRRTAGESEATALAQSLVSLLPSPPIVLERVLDTPEASLCIDLMRSHLLPVVSRFNNKRPRSRRSQSHFRYPQGLTPFRVDVGHLAAHAAAGPPDVNFFPQRSDLNRGHSPGGKVYRSLESYVARNPGTAYFSRLLYDGSDTPIPHFIELGLVLDFKRLSEVRIRGRPPGYPLPKVCSCEGSGVAILAGVFDNYTGEAVEVASLSAGD